MKDFLITRRSESVCDNNCEPIESVIKTLINGSNLFMSDDIDECIDGLETSRLVQHLFYYTKRLTNERKLLEDFVRKYNYPITKVSFTFNSKSCNIPKRKKQKNDYSNNAVPTEMHGRELSQDHKLAHDMVSCALESYNLQMCQSFYHILTRIDYQKGHIYEDEVQRLADHIDWMQKAIYEPRKIENIYQKGSCNFGPGSTQNGNLSLNQ
ncbi:hypothetical protein [uncultured Prevotella sp.]|uniref:hypothetical protein n=1 Tax=uncultured Prevotella sp. TaxID=159272 RepID=UPI0027E2AF69|nr:hypothetical protein [uncultured Prevotella sp.]